MRISAVAFLMILTTVVLSACTQKQTVASVDKRGNNYYGRNGASSYASGFGNAPISQAVEVASVSSKDLPPPSQPAKAPMKPAAAVQAQPIQAQPAAAAAPQVARWQWPVNGKVTQNFGANPTGITIAAAEGTPIHAAQSGEVAFVGQNIRDYGNMVILRHPDGSLTSYSHARNIVVTKGEQVAVGTVIGYVGQSGNAQSPQLHFALREGTHAVDPLGKLPQNVAAN